MHELREGLRFHLPPELDDRVRGELAAWQKEGKTRRLWARDATLWTDSGEERWLGWLFPRPGDPGHLEALDTFAAQVRAEGFTHALLLGMGGSSLAPEVMARVLEPAAGAPRLLVLDSTVPAQVRACEGRIDPARTLFIVSSKSGTTLETQLLASYFLDRVGREVGAEAAGSRFVAVTDPGSALEEEARREGFRRVFHGVPEIGGRFSALSDFGLVPAAVAGLGPRRLLDGAGAMARAAGPGIPVEENPAVILGVILAVAAQQGRDKVTLVASPGLAPLGPWLEQLLAESTGKGGRGLIPVDGEEPGPPGVYGEDRLFVYLRLVSDPDPGQDAAMEALRGAGEPVVEISVTTTGELGQELFRWELATAVAGAILGVNPFDQPDVEAAKDATRRLTAAAEERGGRLPEEEPLVTGDGLALFADPANADALRQTAGGDTVAARLRAHLDRLGDGDYLALLAFLERSPEVESPLQALRHQVRDARGVATCLGFGPRFLHSTGQAHKGGPDSGLFLQITAGDGADLPLPGRPYGFATVAAAQARGDFEVLARRGRRLLRVHLGADVPAGLARLRELVS